MPKNFFNDFLKLIKIGIVGSNLFTGFCGAWLAMHYMRLDFIESIPVFLFGLFGIALVVAGSCCLNNYIDQDIDYLMSRTKIRPTITGTIPLTVVLGMGFLFTVLGLTTLFLISIRAALMGVVGVIVYVVIYSLWAKRNVVANTVIGSISGAVPPLIGWFMFTDQITAITIGLFVLMFIWQPPHFYALAMRRYDEYKNAKLPMLPVLHGFHKTKIHMIGWIIALLPTLFLFKSIGIVFIVIGVILTIGWLINAFRGFQAKDEQKWAKTMFIYSLIYLTVIFAAMIAVTL